MPVSQDQGLKKDFYGWPSDRDKAQENIVTEPPASQRYIIHVVLESPPSDPVRKLFFFLPHFTQEEIKFSDCQVIYLSDFGSNDRSGVGAHTSDLIA